MVSIVQLSHPSLGRCVARVNADALDLLQTSSTLGLVRSCSRIRCTVDGRRFIDLELLIPILRGRRR